MFAVIKSGSKQFKVEAGSIINIDQIEGEAGQKITFDHVLLVANGDDVKIGQPTVKGASVEGEIVDHKRDKKVIIFKKKRRQGYSRKKGHRQNLTTIKVSGIKA